MSSLCSAYERAEKTLARRLKRVGVRVLNYGKGLIACEECGRAVVHLRKSYCWSGFSFSDDTVRLRLRNEQKEKAFTTQDYTSQTH